MGKYIDQASAYRTGMNMLSSSLENIAAKIEEAGTLVSNEDSQDALNYYVTSFNNDIKEAMTSLITKCSVLPVSVMQKASEIDRRIEVEEQASES